MKQSIRTGIKALSLLLCVFWLCLFSLAIADLFCHPSESEPLGAAIDGGLRRLHCILTGMGALASGELAASLFAFWRPEGARGWKRAALLSACFANLLCTLFIGFYIGVLTGFVKSFGEAEALLLFFFLVSGILALLLLLVTLFLLIASALRGAKQKNADFFQKPS